MQYSPYCRSPAEEAGCAKHEISRPERFQPLKFESSGRSPKGDLMGAAALALSELVRQRGNRRCKGKEQEGSVPSNSAAGKRSLHRGKPVCRF